MTKSYYTCSCGKKCKTLKELTGHDCPKDEDREDIIYETGEEV